LVNKLYMYCYSWYLVMVFSTLLKKLSGAVMYEGSNVWVRTSNGRECMHN